MLQHSFVLYPRVRRGNVLKINKKTEVFYKISVFYRGMILINLKGGLR